MSQLYYDTCRKYYFNKLLERDLQMIKYKTLKDFIEENFPDIGDEYEKIASDAEEAAISSWEYYQ